MKKRVFLEAASCLASLEETARVKLAGKEDFEYWTKRGGFLEKEEKLQRKSLQRLIESSIIDRDVSQLLIVSPRNKQSKQAREEKPTAGSVHEVSDSPFRKSALIINKPVTPPIQFVPIQIVDAQQLTSPRLSRNFGESESAVRKSTFIDCATSIEQSWQRGWLQAEEDYLRGCYLISHSVTHEVLFSLCNDDIKELSVEAELLHKWAASDNQIDCQ